MMQLLYSFPPFLTALLLAVLSVATLIRTCKHKAHRHFILLCLLGGLLSVDILIQLNAPSAEIALRSRLYRMILFGTIAFVFGPLKSRVQMIIDHIFAKGRYDYRQTIK